MVGLVAIILAPQYSVATENTFWVSETGITNAVALDAVPVVGRPGIFKCNSIERASSDTRNQSAVALLYCGRG